MGLFTNLEIMIIISVIGFLVFVILLLSILEIISKKKEKTNIEVEVEEPKEKKVEVVKEEAKVIETKMEVNNTLDEEITLETLENDVNSLTEIEPKAEVEKVDINEEASTYDVVETPSVNSAIIEQLEEIETRMNIAPEEEEIEVLELEPEETAPAKNAYMELEKIKEELEHPVSLEATISNLESQEEESAIISYQELLSYTSEMQAITDEDMGDEPISITEVYEKFTGEKMESPSINDIYEASIKSGVETENINEIQLENTANLEKLDKEIRKTNKVLNMLNELKKNLD